MQHGILVLEHAGVKGMKWGVRKADDALMTRVAGYRPAGETKEQKLAYKAWKKTTSRKQRREEKASVIAQRGEMLVKQALKNPKSLIQVSTPDYPMLMVGKEFVNYVSSGGMFDPMRTGTH